MQHSNSREFFVHSVHHQVFECTSRRNRSNKNSASRVKSWNACKTVSNDNFQNISLWYLMYLEYWGMFKYFKLLWWFQFLSDSFGFCMDLLFELLFELLKKTFFYVSMKNWVSSFESFSISLFFIRFMFLCSIYVALWRLVYFWSVRTWCKI